LNYFVGFFKSIENIDTEWNIGLRVTVPKDILWGINLWVALETVLPSRFIEKEMLSLGGYLIADP